MLLPYSIRDIVKGKIVTLLTFTLLNWVQCTNHTGIRLRWVSKTRIGASD